MDIKENNRLNAESQEAVEQKTEVEIYVQKSMSHGEIGFIWAFKESYEKKIFGWAASLDEVERRARRMFPVRNIKLKFF